MNTFVKGLICALGATLIWASNYPVSRFLFGNHAGSFNEFFLTLLRYMLTVLCLLPFTLKRGDWQIFRKDWRRDGKIFVILGVFGLAEGLTAFIALKYTTAARASLMANTSPVFTLLISWLMAREKVTGSKIAGMMLGLAGVILLGCSGGGDMFAAEKNMSIGDMLALLSGVCWALFTVFGTLIAVKYNGAFCACMLRIISLIFILPLLFIFPGNITLAMPAVVWCGIVWLAVFPSGVAVALWSRGQKYLSPGLLGAFGYISALSAALSSVILLGEKISWQLVAAALLIFAGMGAMMRHKK